MGESHHIINVVMSGNPQSSALRATYAELIKEVKKIDRDDAQNTELVFQVSPCANCATNCVKQLPNAKRFRCAQCKYTRYCSSTCQANDWGNHKNMCRHLRANQRHSDRLNKIYNICGLFTNGTGMWASPVKASPTTARVGALLDNLMLCRDEVSDLKLDAALDMARSSLPHILQDVITPEVKINPALPIAVSLGGDCMNFHDQCYGFAFPPDYAAIGDVLRKHGVTKMIDPIAGNRIATSFFEIFAGIPVDASDIAPKHPNVKKANARDASVYANRNSETTGVLIGWPDYGAKGDLSHQIIEHAHAFGYRYIVLLRENHIGIATESYEEAAISEVGLDILNRHYKRSAPVVDSFTICKPSPAYKHTAMYRHVTKEASKISQSDLAIKYTDQLTRDGIGQAIEVYTLRA